MHTYLMTIKHYTGWWDEFTVSADSREDALEKAKKYVASSAYFSGGNYSLDTLKVSKKLKKVRD